MLFGGKSPNELPSAVREWGRRPAWQGRTAEPPRVLPCNTPPPREVRTNLFSPPFYFSVYF